VRVVIRSSSSNALRLGFDQAFAICVSNLLGEHSVRRRVDQYHPVHVDRKFDLLVDGRDVVRL